MDKLFDFCFEPAFLSALFELFNKETVWVMFSTIASVLFTVIVKGFEFEEGSTLL
jgi:hypothetical protein